MNISAPFIRRPVATTLLTAGIMLVGAIAFNVLPVSPLPQVDFPTISVSASLPGGSPEITASSIATPLERQFSHIAGVTEMTSSSSLGSTSITLQFDLSRDIDGAARDVEAAINAARTYLPANLPANPTYRKVNPADAPIIILGLTSDKYDKPTLYDEASSVIAQKLSQIAGCRTGVGRRRRRPFRARGSESHAAQQPRTHNPEYSVRTELSRMLTSRPVKSQTELRPRILSPTTRSLMRTNTSRSLSVTTTEPQSGLPM